MEQAFWHKAWTEKNIGFHNPDAHPFLVEFLPRFNLPVGARVFVPLCGKSLDMHWLLAEGFRVVGVELVETAIVELFEELDVEPEISEDGDHIRYSAQDIDIYVGDMFALKPEQVGKVDFVYDRAALIALPDDMATRYAALLLSLSTRAPQMLIGFEYDQAKLDGPPFALMEDDVQTFYGQTHVVTELARRPLDGGLKGQVPATEIVRALHVR